MQPPLMPDNLRYSLDGQVYELIKLKPFHFLEVEGIPFDVFDVSNQAVGVYAQMAADLEESEKETEADLELIKKTLQVGIVDFDFDATFERFGIEHISTLFNVLLSNSLETFNRLFKPNQMMLTHCHYLAKNYGGTPADYIKGNIDDFLFNINCLAVGVKDESIQAQKAANKNKK